jgi:hypothetical protein
VGKFGECHPFFITYIVIIGSVALLPKSNHQNKNCCNSSHLVIDDWWKNDSLLQPYPLYIQGVNKVVAGV